jgi:hypothetical protein
MHVTDFLLKKSVLSTLTCFNKHLFSSLIYFVKCCMKAMQILTVLKSVKKDLTGFKFKVFIPIVHFFLSLLLQGLKLCYNFFWPNKQLRFIFVCLLWLLIIWACPISPFLHLGYCCTCQFNSIKKHIVNYSSLSCCHKKNCTDFDGHTNVF